MGIRKHLALVSLTLLGACASTEEENEDAITRVLVIGNSFSVTTLSYLPQVAADRGVDLDLASLYIGGCSLKRHWENVLKDGQEGFAPYSFGRNVRGVRTNGRINLCDALRLAKWDIVTVQQASSSSWRPELYHPYGENLVAKIRELAPQAKVYVQETWSYTPWDRRLAKWGLTQDEMYAKLHAAYADFAQANGLAVIPMGAAVQRWRRELPVRYGEHSFGNDVVGGRCQAERDHFKRTPDNRWVPNSDVFHLHERGEYLQALVWAATLFGVDVGKVAYKPGFVTDAEAALMRKIANGD